MDGRYEMLIANPSFLASRLATACILAVVSCLGDVAFGSTTSTWQINPAAEEWVRKQITAGSLADLARPFPKEAERVISGRLIEELLATVQTGLRKNGVQIARAIVAGPLDLRNCDVANETRLISCRFLDEAHLENSQFQRNLDLKGSRFDKTAGFRNIEVKGFASIEGAVFSGPVDFAGGKFGDDLVADNATFTSGGAKASFNGIKVRGDANFRNAVFRTEGEFVAADVAGLFQANGVKFLSREGEADFSQIRVGKSAFFREAVFAGPVVFKLATVEGTLEFDGSTFTDTVRGVSLNAMKIGGIAGLTGVRIDGPSDFCGLTVGLALQADRAQFSNSKGEANLNRIRVGGDTSIVEAAFRGGVDMAGADIKGQLNVSGTSFASTTKHAFFQEIRIADGALFCGTHFTGPTFFTRADISGGLQFIDTAFTDTVTGVDFSEMQVIGGVKLLGTTFAGPARFNHSNIRGSFLAIASQFRCPNESVDFGFLQCGDAAQLQQCLFTGPVRLTAATLLDLVIRNPGETPPAFAAIDLSDTQIGRKLTLANLVMDRLIAPSLRVDSDAVLDRVTVRVSWNAEHSRFTTLELSQCCPPDAPGSVRLDGMAYTHISAGDRDDDWTRLTDLLDRAVYSPTAYSGLSTFFLREGYPERADEVYLAGKRRERENSWKAGAVGKYLWNQFLRVSVNYGRSPLLALGWSMGFILLGFVIFFCEDWSQPAQKAKNHERGSLKRMLFTALCQSFDLFIPLVNWPPAKTATFQGSHWFTYVYWIYIRVHMLAGWLLIPIAVASWTGIIK